MKRTITFVCFLVVVAIFPSCRKASIDIQQPQTSGVTATSIEGNFTITSYRQASEDKISKYKGFVFTFSATGTSGGTVTAVKDASKVNGSWIYSPAVTYYGSTSKNSIVLGLGNATPLDRLTGTWNLDSISTSTKLVLSHPEIREDEHLVFTKQ